jgi:hypothetical protein
VTRESHGTGKERDTLHAAKRRRVTVTITHDAYAKAKREAADSNKTVAQWIAWLVEDYAPPEEVDSDA